jgi:hypothetical protein
MAKLTVKNNYATIPNNFLNRNDISLKAKGLFAYLQSKPNDWQFSKERIALQLKEGIDSLKSAFSELKKAGYLKTVPQKNSEGKFIGWDYILDDNPTGGKTVGGEIHPSENPTDISKKEYSKKDIEKKNKEYTFFQKKQKKPYFMNKPMTQDLKLVIWGQNDLRTFVGKKDDIEWR